MKRYNSLKNLLNAVLLLLCSMILFSCNTNLSLGEKEGAFAEETDISQVTSYCHHAFSYERANINDESGRYQGFEYHYVYCLNSKYTDGCTERGRFEFHESEFYGIYAVTELKYNLGYYHAVQSICKKCKSTPYVTGYVLCSENSNECNGNCSACVEYREEHGTQ